jgi:hypothetical protein
MSASLLTKDSTAFRGQVSVFKGDDCENLECIDGSVIGIASWESVQDEKYFILVHGQSVLEGDFRLQISLEPVFPPLDVADPCPALDSALVVSAGSSTSDSTFDEPLYDVASCGNLVFSTAPGTWFCALGTGGALTVSTCGAATSFDTQISIFAGVCNSLQCIGGNDQSGDCGDGSTVSWFTLQGEEYLILGKTILRESRLIWKLAPNFLALCSSWIRRTRRRFHPDG